MPESVALYRRWRPQRFAEVVGQQHVTRTLRRAIATGQVAHAYLLAGPRGIGKTSIARLIAKAVNCPNAADGEPCDRCPSCVSIREGRFLDLIEIDAASNRGIDEMRDLREKVRFAPSEGQYKVYVVDEAHQLTAEAFNALLKTLEEPPGHVIFVLATTESQKIPATIVSRTQRFDLRRIPHADMVTHLERIAAAERVGSDRAALAAIARHAQGSLRDAEGILDQLSSFSDDRTVSLEDVDDLLGASGWDEVAELFDAFGADDGARAVALVGRLVDEGRDLHLFARRAIEHVRSLVLARYTGRVPDTMAEDAAARTKEQAARFAPDRLARIAKRLVEAEQQLRVGEGTPLPLELAVLELTTATADHGAPQAGPRRAEPARTADPDVASGRGSRPRRLNDVAGTAAASYETPLTSTSGSAARATTRDDAASAHTGTGRATTSSPEAITLERVHEAWTAVVEGMHERSVAKAAQLLTAEPVAVEGSTVVIGFAEDFAWNAWQERQRGELERDLARALGVEVRVRCVRHKPQGVPPATDDPMLRAALETFRRPERILEVE